MQIPSIRVAPARLNLLALLACCVPVLLQSIPSPGAEQTRDTSGSRPRTSLTAQKPAPGPEKSEERIDVTADQLSVLQRGEAVEARGNVVIRHGETTFGADEVEINRTTQDLKAKGNVSLDDPEYKLLKASELNMNLRNETGLIRNADIFIEKDHLSLSGSRLEKFVGQVYEVEDGLFTTCLCESGAPPWRIGAKEIRLNRDGEGEIRDGKLYIFDVPILYLPYAVFPVQSERSTGFLFPRIGSSSGDGFLYQQPFFWAINKSNDASLTFSVQSSSRVGSIGEYRTVLSRNTAGKVRASYFNENLRTDRAVGDPYIADPTIPIDRWSVSATHRNYNPSGWITYSNISAYSDDLFTRELFDLFDLSFAQEGTIRTSRFSRSRLGFYRNWKDIRLRGEWNLYQDFIQPQENTLQGTPGVSFSGNKTLWNLWDSPVELGWNVRAINYLREQDADGFRIDLRPEITLPLRIGPYLKWSTSVALRETFYHLYDTSGMFSPAQDDFSGNFARNKSRELAEIRWKLTTSFGHVFSWNGSRLKKISHVVEPEVSYFFVPSTDQSDIPLWDETDRINRRNVLTFALSNRFWGKRAPASTQQAEAALSEVDELGRFRIAMSFDIDKARSGADSLSDIDMSLSLTPVHYFSMQADWGIDPGRWDISQASVGFYLSDPRPLTLRVPEPDFSRPNRVGVSYRYIRQSALSPLATDANLNLLTDCPGDPQCQDGDPVNQLNLSGLYHFTDHVLLLYSGNYDGVAGRFTSNEGGIKYLSKCECWTVGFFVNKLVNPDQTNFRISFSVVGLGRSLGFTQGIGGLD